MPAKALPRPSSVLFSVLAAAAFGLTVAGCGVAPLGPTPPQPHHLRSPFVLQALRAQPSGSAGRCPAGSVALSGGPDRCYSKLGTPVTFTSAAISPPASLRPASPSGQHAGPVAYRFIVALPAADQTALTAVTTTAADSKGFLAITVAGRTWLLPRVLRPFPAPQFAIMLPSGKQTLRLRHLLAPPG